MPATRRPDTKTMPAAAPEETCVVLRLEFGGCSRQELEDCAILIQEVVDSRAAEAAPGAAIRCVHDPLTVEVLFTVENATRQDVHQRVAAVVGAIESVLPVAFDTDAATRSTDRRELVAA
jgi:hypothetical protein